MPQKRTTKSGKTRWVGRYRDPAGKERSRSFDTRREATAWEAERQRELRRGEWISPEDQATTLLDLAAAWKAEAVKPNTVANRKSLIDNLGALGVVPIGLIRPADISEWNAVLLGGRPWAKGKPLAASTVAVMSGQVAGLLKQAHQDLLLARVPRFPVPKAPPKRAISRQDLVTPEEIRALIDVAMMGRKNRGGPPSPARPWLARMVWVAVGTGMRISELCALQPRDVHVEALEVDVVRQVVRGGRRTADLKTEVPRVVPVPREVVDVLLEQIEVVGAGSADPIFPHSSRPMHDRNSAGQALARVVGVLGMRSITFHDFRHFYASVLIGSGAPVSEVQRALGHTNASTTLDTYTHFWSRGGGVARDLAAGALGLVRDPCGIETSGASGGGGTSLGVGQLRAG